MELKTYQITIQCGEQHFSYEKQAISMADAVAQIMLDPESDSQIGADCKWTVNGHSIDITPNDDDGFNVSGKFLD